MTTTSQPETYGGQLYDELRKLSGYDIIVGRLSYDAIQQLKLADRQQTLKLFQGSSYPVLQQIKTQDPSTVAAFLVQEVQAGAATGAAIIISMMGFP